MAPACVSVLKTNLSLRESYLWVTVKQQFIFPVLTQRQFFCRSPLIWYHCGQTFLQTDHNETEAETYFHVLVMWLICRNGVKILSQNLCCIEGPQPDRRHSTSRRRTKREEMRLGPDFQWQFRHWMHKWSCYSVRFCTHQTFNWRNKKKTQFCLERDVKEGTRQLQVQPHETI